jgi:hypothetical protein
MLVKATVGPVKYHPKAIAVILRELDKAAGRFDEGAVEAPLKEWRGCANDVLWTLQSFCCGPTRMVMISESYEFGLGDC